MPLLTPAELTSDNWHRVNRELLAKALSEFSYEELLTPEATDTLGQYKVAVSDKVKYLFNATRGAYDSWHVEPDSVLRAENGIQIPGDNVLLFVHEIAPIIGMTGENTGHLIRELTATLIADTHLLETRIGSKDAAKLSYAELEGYQTGHPWIVANKGRMGFSASDAQQYAPEARQPVRLSWIAVEQEISEYHGVAGLDAEYLYSQELDEATRQRFTKVLNERGLNPDRYLMLPTHPWQWDETILPLFAPDVAQQRIVVLGESSDEYLPQQSIRTFTNVTSPERHYIKLPMSILNTMVWRGLPTERTLTAPALTQWVLSLAKNDPYLAEETRVVLLGEVASVTVFHQALEKVPGVSYQYKELLGAIWREPLTSKLDSNEHGRTLSSLLYVDAQGRSLLAELVTRSGLAPREWLRSLFRTMLPPLLHFLYRYGLVFSPHGQNTIIAFDENEIPTRLIVKDFVDDVNVSSTSLPELEVMPPEVSKVLLREPPDFLCQFIHAGLFIGHYRYLAQLAATELDVSQGDFWIVLREEIKKYQQRFPELSERFKLFDMFMPRIDRLCLNRNRLLIDGYQDRLERPHATIYGTIPNPLAGFAE